MCGILGVIFSEGSDKAKYIKDCALLQQHRGPDYFGQLESNEYFFYHNRLSIINTSAYANQPLENNKAILLYNGEIYNYKTIFQELKKENHDNFIEIASSDTRVLFELLSTQGLDVVKKLNGMFAFSFFNKDKNQLFLCRDRMGIKPLYYSFYNDVFCFSSELKSLLCVMKNLHGYKPICELDSRGVDDLLALGHAEFQQLPFHNIVEVKPGCIVHYDVNEKIINTQPYIEFHKDITAKQVKNLSQTSEKKLIEKLDKLLDQSVQQHLVSDVPVGTLCSGGIDSSLITALAVKYNPNIVIYHAGVEEGIGEEAYAEKIAQHLDININYIKMSAERYFSLLVDVIYYSDFPIYHPSDISLYAIAEKARQDKIKVLLCGEGADEFFGGYAWHLYFKKHYEKYSFSKKVVFFIEFILNKLGIYKNATTLSQKEFSNYTPSSLNYFTESIQFSAKRNAIIRNPASWEYFDQLLKSYEDALIDQPEVAAYISHNLYGHLGSLLHRNDRMCMMASIEARVPFIENNILNFALNLPTHLKIKNKETKHLLKKVAERYIPYDNVYRKKAGFPVPWSNYLQKINVDMFQKGFLCHYLNISHSALKRWFADDKLLLGLALSIEIWGRLFVLEENLEDLKNSVALA